MAYTITHPYISSVTETTPSGGVNGRVGPTEWNAIHTITGTPDNVTLVSTSSQTWWISASGNDASSGSSSAPFATLQKAINVAASYNWANQYSPNINAINGTYPSGALNAIIPPFRGLNPWNQSLNITGNTATPTSVQASSGDFGLIVAMDPQQSVWMSGFYYPGGNFLQVYSGVFGNTVNTNNININFGGSAGLPFFVADISNQKTVTGIANIYILFGTLDFTAATGFQWFLLAEGGCATFVDAHVLFPASSFTVTNQFIAAGSGAQVQIHQVNHWSNFGVPTGQRLSFENGATWYSQNGLQTDVPGNSDGVCDNTAIFVATNIVTASSVFKVASYAGPPAQGSQSVSGLLVKDSVGWFKDSTNGPRTFAFDDGGTVYTRQIGNFINTQTSTNYTLALFDQEGVVEMNNAGANTLSVPSSTAVAFPLGTKVSVVQAGAGVTTVVASSGVTVRNAGALSAQWKPALLYNRASNEWVQINGAF